MKAIVLAGGKGLRMRPLTEKVPKAMVEVAGKPILEWILENLANAGAKEVLVVVGYMRNAITNYFGHNFKGMKINYVWQVKQLGTGNALAITENHNDASEFIVLNGDVIVEAKLIKELIGIENFDAVVVGREEKEPWKYGCLKIEGNLVREVVEKPSRGKEPGFIVSCGIFKFNRKVYDELRSIGISERQEYELTDALKKLIENGKVGFLLNKGICIDVGCHEDLEKAGKELAEK